jgi:cytochrome c oxidase subunit 2
MMSGEHYVIPEQASTIAREIDRLYAFLWAVSGVMTLLIGFLILYFAIKYRRDAKVDRSLKQSHFFLIEAAWIIGPFIILMIIFFWGAHLYIQQSRAPVGAMEITGIGRQWMWKFQHPNGRAEINEMHIPLHQAIKVRLISEDVIHSLFIPAFRVKQDVLPGRYTSLWFQAIKTGKYHLFCAEYCGAKHSGMRGYVHVLEPSQYQEWLSSPSEMSAVTANVSLLEQFRCNTCHQGSAMVARAPALENLFGSSVRLQDGRTIVADETYIRESIVRPQAKVVAGYPLIMPTFEAQIDEEGLNRLIDEIKRLGQGPRDNAIEDDRSDVRTGPEQVPANGAASGGATDKNPAPTGTTEAKQ